jgi:thiosulfate/3-mercaptopyruvate sulfurtransferase
MVADQYPRGHAGLGPEGYSPLVSGRWLADHLDTVRVVDVRWYLDPARSGWDEYRTGHVPGAVWLDLETDLSGPPSPAAGRHPLPTEAAFAGALGRMGIAEGTPVVAYDDAGGSTAARLWWLLRALGEPVAVLDGGLAAWPGELSTEIPVPVPVQRPVREWPAARFADADQVAASDRAVFDARTAERYAHGDPAIDPRPGHVPGAHSAPWAANLDEHGLFRSPAELRARYGAADDGAIAYCGSGVTACHDLLAMTIAGFDDLALYPGSWSQWGADATRAAETS